MAKMKAYEELQARAKASWEALSKSPKTRIIVGSATCGRAAGGGHQRGRAVRQ